MDLVTFTEEIFDRELFLAFQTKFSNYLLFPYKDKPCVYYPLVDYLSVIRVPDFIVGGYLFFFFFFLF